MHAVPRRFRLKKSAPRFLRSCLPADLTQLLFLAGLVCLTVAAHQRWVPTTTEGLDHLSMRFGGTLQTTGSQGLGYWVEFISVARIPILVSYLAGYWIAFRPGRNPIRRVFTWVLLPALCSVFAICGFWLYVDSASISVLDKGSAWKGSLPRTAEDLWAIGPGFFYGALGIALVGVFWTQLWLRKTALPLALAETSANPSTEQTWPGVEIVVWAMLGAQFVVFSFLGAGISFLFLQFSDRQLLRWFTDVSHIFEAAVLIGICALSTQREEMRPVWRSMWPQTPSLALLGALFPGILAAVFTAVLYLPQRFAWATHGFWKDPPSMLFEQMPQFDPRLLLVLVAAFGEEFVFRGILQRRFVERYGLFRGLVLVGVIWGVFHFPGRAHAGSVLEVLPHLISRTAVCVAIGLVLSWLTLRSGSILPATIAHGASNILIYMGFFNGLGPFDIARILEWGLLAYLLFRYWPPRITQAGVEVTAAAGVQPAV